MAARPGCGDGSPGEMKRRETELGSHRELDKHFSVQKRSRGGRWSWAVIRELDNPLLQLFLNSCFSDIVTLLHTAVETAISEVHKLLGTVGVPTSLTLLFWRWLTVSSVC